MRKRRTQSPTAQHPSGRPVNLGTASAQQPVPAVIPTEAPKPKDRWDKADVLGKILGSILIPTVIAAATLYINSSLQDRATKQKQVDTAITILQSPKSDDLPSLKAWALKEVYAALNLPTEARKELEISPLPSSYSTSSIELRPPDPALITDLQSKLHGAEKNWMGIALSEIGIPSDDRIREYNIAAGTENLPPGVPWNGQFVNWVMMKAGYAGTHSGLARSWLNWGIACEGKPGAIVVLSLPSPMPQTSGTVGFYVGADKNNDIILLGGNIFRQVTTTVRPRSSLLGFRCPSPNYN